MRGLTFEEYEALVDNPPVPDGERYDDFDDVSEYEEHVLYPTLVARGLLREIVMSDDDDPDYEYDIFARTSRGSLAMRIYEALNAGLS